jgi:hypothetical protein
LNILQLEWSSFILKLGTLKWKIILCFETLSAHRLGTVTKYFNYPTIPVLIRAITTNNFSAAKNCVRVTDCAKTT